MIGFWGFAVNAVFSTLWVVLFLTQGDEIFIPAAMIHGFAAMFSLALWVREDL